jgi:trehalose 6-phosphate phosphatase
MRDILSRRNLAILEEFANSNVLVAFDYDGTLAPIVTDPARATIRARTRRLLAQLVALYPCVVISGRMRSDTQDRLKNIGVVGIVGNHGLEPAETPDRHTARVAEWREQLERALSPHRGIHVEDKGLSLAVHYRRSREKRTARAAILGAVQALGPVRVIGGKQVVNVLPEGAPDKGSALERERRRLLCDTAIYVGDDETDEDVFRLDQPGRLLTIRVGDSTTSLAHYCIGSQRDIDAVIAALVRFRRTAPGVRQRA